MYLGIILGQLFHLYSTFILSNCKYAVSSFIMFMEALSWLFFHILLT